jgi:hypothetical protein
MLEAIWRPVRGAVRIPRTIEPHMRVPDYLLKCVGFVAEVISDASGATFDHIGTGFFVTIPSDDPSIAETVAPMYFAFVTAAHIARALSGRMTAFIVNKRGGGVMVIPELANRWYSHPSDPSVDVAIIPFNWDFAMDILAIPTRYFVSKPLSTGGLLGSGLGIGDEVFMPGLFTYAIGAKRNMPIIRYGTLAMIPDEPIQIESGFADSYLIEARSIGGISGSPVFIRPTDAFQPSPEAPAVHGVLGLNVLLGLMHGHWDIKESDMNEPHYSHNLKHGVNMGIGVVVPAHKILEVINQPELVAMRKQADEKQRWDVIPTPDKR